MYQVSRPLLSKIDARGVAEIQRAEEFIAKAHHGQLRAEGVPYITHLIAVAELTASWGCDADTIMAALLHDVVEDTPVVLSEVREVFGEDVAMLVDGATKVESPDRQLADELTRQKILTYTLSLRIGYTT
jgi:(p)ppGpp synthase/HD superfamily hydrolase